MLVAATRARQAFTHFISLPVNLPYFQEKVLHLKVNLHYYGGKLFEELKIFVYITCIYY